MKRIVAFLLAALMLLVTGCGTVEIDVADGDQSAEAEVIYNDGSLVNLATASKEVRVAPAEKAYVRSGSNWANKNWRQIIAERGLDTNNEEVLVLKNGGGEYTRYVMFTFDLDEIAEVDYQHVFFSPSFIQVDDSTVVKYDIYLLDPASWDTDTVTWNTMPKKGELIYKDAVAGGLSKIDLTDAVEDLIIAGKDQISFIMIMTSKSGESENRINPKTTSLIATDSDEVLAYATQLVEDDKKNQEIWDWAQKLYDEWYVRYKELLAEEDHKVEKIVSDADEYSKNVLSTGSSSPGTYKTYKTRTMAALDDLGKYSDYDREETYDIYGGIMIEELRQQATGFFYSKKLGDRWWIIDPLGYPCYIRALSGIGINYLNSPNHTAAAHGNNGTTEKWAIAITRQLKTLYYFNAGTLSTSELNRVEGPMISQKSVGFAGSYGSKIGSNASKGGSTTFSENNTMNVFDPGFEKYADERASTIVGSINDPWILGYTTDNELPMDANMLQNYLSIDYTKEMNYYSYATAWTWLVNWTGKDNPTDADIDEEALQLFRGFVWDRYYYVVTTAMRKYDPNHMILGTRFLTKVKDAEWVLRFAARYLDCMTINWYGQWQPDADDLYDICRFGDLPLMVTEFYTKAMDSGLANTRGAGWVVPTQQDRGDFYQNFTLRLLECKNFVGWHWFQFLDNDPSPEVIYKNGKDGEWRDQSSIDGNKGLYDNEHHVYPELAQSMAEINENVYRLIDHFDAKYDK